MVHVEFRCYIVADVAGGFFLEASDVGCFMTCLKGSVCLSPSTMPGETIILAAHGNRMYIGRDAMRGSSRGPSFPTFRFAWGSYPIGS